MSSLTTRPSGARAIQFSPGELPNGKRSKLSLGPVSLKQARMAQGHIDTIARAKRIGAAMPEATAAWLVSVGGPIRQRLEHINLVDPIERPEAIELGQWISKYIENRKRDLKPLSISSYQATKKLILEYFDPSKRLADITPGDGEDFLSWLKGERGLSEGTARRHFKRARQYLTAAHRRELITRNPFADIKAGDYAEDKFRYIEPEEISQVMRACPDSQWRLLFALARYGGLRIPSEALNLTWDAVNWSEGLITVESPKTAHHPGKGSRVIPIFEELRPYLQEAFELAPEGEPRMIYSYPRTATNLRTQAHRIITRAGLSPWPKTFINLRSSRETELMEGYPIQCVTTWLGNSPKIALKHYLQVTPDHISKAQGGCRIGCIEGAKTGAEQSGTKRQQVEILNPKGL